MATVKEINHDSSTVIGNHYSSVTDPDGAITVGAAAALDGSTYGVEMDYDAGANDVTLSEGFTFSATELRMRFWVNINTAVYAGIGANPLQVKLITSDSDTLFNVRVNADAAGDFNLIYEYLEDSGTSIGDTGYDFSATATCVELRAIRATSAIANDGEVEIYVDGVSVASKLDLDNFTDWNDVLDTVTVEFTSPAGLTGALYYDEWILDDDNTASLGCGPGALSLAAMTKPADVDAAGEYIYVALLEGGTPILSKISTALDADGTTVFDPGAGTNIGVECGRFNSDVIWVAGNFDGTNVIEKSEDGGATFEVKDDATIGDVRAFDVGPDSDERILLFDETNGDILETIDDGGTWVTINTGITPEVNAIGRLGENVQESVFGNAGAASDSIDYSVNSGASLEDYQTGVYPNADATGVIVN